jgi:spore maturation protein SpmB
VIALRAAAGSADPAGILPTTLFATTFNTVIAVLAVKVLQRFSPEASAPAQAPTREEPASTPGEVLPEEATAAYPWWASALALTAIALLIPLSLFYGTEISPWVIPGIMMALLAFGLAGGVAVYEVFVEGARDGFQVAVRIIPYMVAILVAVGMFRSSGAMSLFVGALSPFTAPLGLPAEALPMAFLRPLSGSGAFALLASLLKDPAIGPDSYTGYLISTMSGSTETTFYVLAVYFGSVGVTKFRHTVAAALISEVAGVVGSIIAVNTYMLVRGG